MYGQHYISTSIHFPLIQYKVTANLDFFSYKGHENSLIRCQSVTRCTFTQTHTMGDWETPVCLAAFPWAVRGELKFSKGKSFKDKNQLPTVTSYE